MSRALCGGGLHTTTGDGWILEVVVSAWPHERVLLSRDGGLPHRGPYGERWWHIFHSDHSDGVSLWTRENEPGPLS